MRRRMGHPLIFKVRPSLLLKVRFVGSRCQLPLPHGRMCHAFLASHLSLLQAGQSAGVLQHEKDGSCPPASGQVFADSAHSVRLGSSRHAHGPESPSLIHAQEDESFPPFQGQAFLPVSGQVCGKPFTARALQVPLATQAALSCSIGHAQVSATDRSAVALRHKEDVSCPPALGQVFPDSDSRSEAAQPMQLEAQLVASSEVRSCAALLHAIAAWGSELWVPVHEVSLPWRIQCQLPPGPENFADCVPTALHVFTDGSAGCRGAGWGGRLGRRVRGA